MKNIILLTAALLAVVALSAGNRVVAAEVTFFGDFEDDFGVASYDSLDPPMPGSFGLEFTGTVLGIPKFDPSLGTLTDITVFIDPGTLFYTLGGSLDAVALMPDFTFADVIIAGDVGVYYEDPSFAFLDVIVDFFDISGTCDGMPGDGGCGAPLDFLSDDGEMGGGAPAEVDGSTSIIASVDPADFVGPGDVDSLFVLLFLETTGTFDLENADATASVDWDVFDGDSGADDPVIGVTYTFTPIPEPTTLLLAVSALALLGGLSRRP